MTIDYLCELVKMICGMAIITVSLFHIIAEWGFGIPDEQVDPFVDLFAVLLAILLGSWATYYTETKQKPCKT